MLDTQIDRANVSLPPGAELLGQTTKRADFPTEPVMISRARGRANVSETTSAELPAPNPIERANGSTPSNEAKRAQPHSDGQMLVANHAPAAVRPGSQKVPVTHDPQASGKILAAGQLAHSTQGTDASGEILPSLVEQWRRRQDMLRARQRLELQAQAVCRRFCDGDKVAAAKLWGEVKADPAHDLRGWLNPFLAAMAPLDSAKGEIEKALVKLVKQTHVYEWAQGIKGLGDVSLAAILGECAIGPGEYKSVSALWKRMGLAVIEGGRQRRVTGAAALDHGYNAERRSLMWNISASLIKAQLRSEKGEDGKKVEGSSYALGELGQVYLDRKAYQVARNADREELWTPAHIHNDAARFMTKRLLRMLWQNWRGANGTATPESIARPANPIQGAVSKTKPTSRVPPETDPRRAIVSPTPIQTAPGGELAA